MYSNRKKFFIMTTVALCCMISACASSGKLMTDTGSGTTKEIKKEDYLNVEALNQPKDEESKTNYKVYTLEKGTFTDGVLNQTLPRTYLNVPTINLEMEDGEVMFGEYVSQGRMEYLEAGEVIATVHTEVDEVMIEEAKIKLTRLQERYQKAQQDLTKALEEIEEEKEDTGNPYILGMLDNKCEQLLLDFDKSKRNYEREIEDVTEEIAELEEKLAFTEITTPESGYVVYESKYATGEELKDGDYICHILTNEDFYLQSENFSDEFEYGMTMDFRSGSSVGQGTVISAGSRGLYGNLDTGKTAFLVAFSDEVSASSRRQISSMVMEGSTRTMENVVLVPVEAVTVADENYYVTVLNEDGSLLKTEFIPGGDNPEYYWVYEGLTEGTKIVYQ